MSTDSPAQVAEKYLTCLAAHDITAALELLSDSFVLEFEGGPSLDKAGLAKALGWDTGTEGSLEWQIVSEGPRDVTFEGHETNQFLSLIGVDPLEFRSRFEVDDEGRIQKQVHATDWSGVSIPDALAPAIEWATEHAPAELEGAYPNGAMVYSEESGRRWVALLRRWRSATSEGRVD